MNLIHPISRILRSLLALSAIVLLQPTAHAVIALPAGLNIMPLGDSVGITLTKPMERVVYQRTYSNLVNVQIKGTYTGASDSVEARAVVRAGFGGTTTAWLVIASEAGQFEGTLPVTGGWYDVEVRTLSGGVQSGIATVQRVGVGEVFITAGQSNAACFGSPAQTPADDRVLAYNLSTASWQLANDPQPCPGAGGSGGSPWPHLGDLLAAKYNVPIGIVCVAVGGTKVIQWQPGTTFYGYIQSAINSLKPTGGFRAILWHQGESDSNPPTGDAPNSSWDEVYSTNLQNVIAQSRIDAGATVPWGVALASWNGTGAANYAHVTNGQHLVIDNYPAVFLGSQTDLFHSQNLPYFSDGIHFNQQGLDTHGQQWLNALVTANIIQDLSIIVDAGTSTVVASPAIVSNDGITPSTITVTLKELGGKPVAGRLVSLAQTSGPGTAVMTIVSDMTGSSGTATFRVTSTTAGTYLFTATDTTDIPNVVVTQTAAVTFSTGAVSIANSTVTSAPSSVVADGSSTCTITATLKDVAGLPVPGKTVALAQTSGPATPSLVIVSGTSDAAGQATFTVAATRAGVYGFQATADSGAVVLTQTATMTFVAGAVSAANSTLVVNTPVLAADNAATATLTVTLKDANNNPVAGQSVTLASSRGASDTVSPASGPSSEAGVVTFAVRSATPGMPVFTATATTDAPGVVVTATVTITFYAANLGTLIGHWSLDETSGTTAVTDVNAIFNGTIMTGTTLNQSGKIVKAFNFNGSGKVDLGALPWCNTMTLSAWINPGTDTSPGRNIFSWGVTSPSIYYSQYRLSGGKLQYQQAGGMSGTATSAASVNTTGWTHVVAVKNGARLQLYLDGTADGSAANLSGTMPAGTSANIGYLPTFGYGFSGGIDDVAMWNTALTAGKVRALSTITAVLNAYDAGKMDKLFQVYDGALGSYNDGTRTWLQVTGLTGHNAGDAWADGTTYYVQLDSVGGGVSTTTGAPVVPTKLVITAVNNGVNPIAGTPFSVVVQAQDAGGTPRTVTEATTMNLSPKTGTGTLGGTVSGTLAAGASSVTISGVTYSTAESGVVLTATRTGGDSLTAADSAPFTVSSITVTFVTTLLAEDFEHEWADNALGRTTNGWTSSSLSDQSSITNPASGYGPLPYGRTFPLIYNHLASRRVLKVNTQGDMLLTPTLNAGFAEETMYADMMVQLAVCEGVPSDYAGLKSAVFFKADGATTNLYVFHGQMTEGGFGVPVFTPVTNGIVPESWHRLTVMFAATTHTINAEAFRVLIDGQPLVSTNAYSDAWATRIAGNPYTPDNGTWFLSAARRAGTAGTNLTSLAYMAFMGVGFIDDLVVTSDEPTFSLGTVLLLACGTTGEHSTVPWK